MPPQPSPWYAIARAGEATLSCAACHQIIDVGPSFLDHHPGICLACGVESAFLHWREQTIQIVPTKAPPVIASVLRLLQERLDELEYVELVTALEPLMADLHPASTVEPFPAPPPPPKPVDPPPRPRPKAASKLWDVLGTIEKPQAELAKLVTNTLAMKFALIPAGTFRMGSPPGEGGRRENEGPVHDVILTKPFYLAYTPVTQAQYQAVMGTNPARFQGAAGGGWEHPVECVSWDDAAAFCQKLGEKPAEKAAGYTYRLPTEAEWEYACRAGSVGPFHFGDSLDASQACFDGSYPYGEGRFGPTAPRTARVLSFAANHFGLYDMHGNVWEWCADWFDADYYRSSPRQDPPGPASGTFRVLRGGGWRNQAATCRTAYRNALAPNQRQPFIGFRVVLMLTASDA